MRNTKPQVVCEFIFDIRQPKQNKELTEKFKTGEFVLFGFIPEKGWRKVWYQSIGSVDKYKLVRKK